MPAVNKKPIEAYKTIGETSKILNIPAYVLRFWEKEFKQIKPYKSNSRRYYSLKDIETIATIKDLLYNKGYTIEGARNILKAPADTMPNLKKIEEVLQKLKCIQEELRGTVVEN